MYFSHFPCMEHVSEHCSFHEIFRSWVCWTPCRCFVGTRQVAKLLHHYTFIHQFDTDWCVSHPALQGVLHGPVWEYGGLCCVTAVEQDNRFKWSNDCVLSLFNLHTYCWAVCRYWNGGGIMLHPLRLCLILLFFLSLLYWLFMIVFLSLFFDLLWVCCYAHHVSLSLNVQLVPQCFTVLRVVLRYLRDVVFFLLLLWSINNLSILKHSGYTAKTATESNESLT